MKKAATYFDPGIWSVVENQIKSFPKAKIMSYVAYVWRWRLTVSQKLVSFSYFLHCFILSVVRELSADFSGSFINSMNSHISVPLCTLFASLALLNVCKNLRIVTKNVWLNIWIVMYILNDLEILLIFLNMWRAYIWDVFFSKWVVYCFSEGVFYRLQ